MTQRRGAGVSAFFVEDLGKKHVRRHFRDLITEGLASGEGRELSDELIADLEQQALDSIR